MIVLVVITLLLFYSKFHEEQFKKRQRYNMSENMDEASFFLRRIF